MLSKMGVLPDHLIESLLGAGKIKTDRALDQDQVQPASIDLRLSNVAHRIRASFLPGRKQRVSDTLGQTGMQLHSFEIPENGAVLETGCVYLVPLSESLNLPDGIAGRTNPKSSTGRIDVFTRVVTDFGMTFDQIPKGYSGPLWLEISPRTFPILVRPGDRLAQLRLRHSHGEDLREETVSINLKGEPDEPIGWRAKRHGGLIDLRALGGHDISRFWEPLYAHHNRLVLDPEEFYILASRELVKIPNMQAAEMAPVAPELGEFRAHYAGFFDPGFGTNSGGSRAVLEVRSRDVPFILEHGQPIAKLVFETMASAPEKIYGGAHSHYQGQGLKLSKHFRSGDES